MASDETIKGKFEDASAENAFGEPYDTEFAAWKEIENNILDQVSEWKDKPYASALAQHVLNTSPESFIFDAVEALQLPNGMDLYREAATRNPFSVFSHLRYENILYGALLHKEEILAIVNTPDVLKKAAEALPLSALHFAHENEEHPLKDEVAAIALERENLIKAANEKPDDIFWSYKLFKNSPHAEDTLREAIAKSSYGFYAYLANKDHEEIPIYDELNAIASREDALTEMIEKNPFLTAYSYSHYQHQPYADQIRQEALREDRIMGFMADKSFYEYGNYLEVIKDQPYAATVFTKALQQSSYSTKNIMPIFIDEDYAKNILSNVPPEALRGILDYFTADKIAQYPDLFEIILDRYTESDFRQLILHKEKFVSYPGFGNALEKVAAKEPGDIFLYFEDLSSLPNIARIVAVAAASVPEKAFSSYGDFKGQPYAISALEVATRANPFAFLRKEASTRKIIDRLAREGNSGHIEELIDRGFLLDEDTRKHLLGIALEQDLSAFAANNPISALETYELYIDLPDVDKIYALALNPENILANIETLPKNMGRVIDVIGHYKHLKEAPKIIETALEKSQDVVHDLIERYSDYQDQLWAIPVLQSALDKNPVEYYRYRKELLEKTPENLDELDKYAQRSLDGYLDGENKTHYLQVVNVINHLHEEDSALRFAIVDNEVIRPDELFDLVVLGREEVYTSTYQGLIQRFLDRSETQELSLTEFFQEDSRFDKLPVFLEAAASYGWIEQVMDRLPANQEEAIIQKMIDTVGSSEKLDSAVSLAELMNHIDDPAVSKVFEDALIIAYEAEENIAIQDKYGLIASWYAQAKAGSIQNIEFFENISGNDRYALPNLESVPTEKLFDAQGRHIQMMTFFDDGKGGDGELSFNNFMARYENNDKWQVTDHKGYVHIQSTRGNKEVHIYANKPEFDGSDDKKDGIKDMQSALEKMDPPGKVHTFIHRGHSYHVGKSLEFIDPQTSMVFLGSCGGYQNIAKVLGIASDAHIISTKGTGTMYVNDPLFYRINDSILRRGEAIVWDDVWAYVNGLGDKRKEQYINPSDNTAVQFIAKYNSLRGEEPNEAVAPTVSNEASALTENNLAR